MQKLRDQQQPQQLPSQQQAASAQFNSDNFNDFDDYTIPTAHISNSLANDGELSP